MASFDTPSTFKAYTYEKFGQLDDILKITEVATEPLPASHVRVRVHSASLNPIDYKLVEIYQEKYTQSSPSAEKPFRIGFDFTGIVVEVGSGDVGFQVGDQVYGKSSRIAAGSLGEFVSLDAQLIALKPKTLDFDHAAGVPGVALTSYQALAHHGSLQAGERVLILGGSSSTGIFGIQYAKSIGASVLTTTSTKNVDFVKSLGADQVIDYRTQDWAKEIEPHSVDVVYDCGVEPASWEDRAQLVLKKQTGRFVTLRRGLAHSEAKYGASYSDPHTNPSGRDLGAIAELIDAGKIKTFIDSVFPFEQALAAFARLKSERAVGKVIVKVLK